jgi:hypothetical protein
MAARARDHAHHIEAGRGKCTGPSRHGAVQRFVRKDISNFDPDHARLGAGLGDRVILTRLRSPSEDALSCDAFVELVITLLLAKGYEEHEVPGTLRQFNQSWDTPLTTLGSERAVRIKYVVDVLTGVIFVENEGANFTTTRLARGAHGRFRNISRGVVEGESFKNSQTLREGGLMIVRRL